MPKDSEPYPTDQVTGLIIGDEVAWTRIVLELQPKLLRFAKRLGLRHQEAEDSVQDMWPRAMKKIYLRPLTVLYRAFFYWQVRDSVSRIVRRLKREPSISLDRPFGEDGTLVDQLVDVSNFVDAFERRDLWDRALATLTNEERYVVRRKFFDGATYKEISHEFCTTLGRAVGILTRAKCKLKEYLQTALTNKQPGE